jgi:hypothetical protein
LVIKFETEHLEGYEFRDEDLEFFEEYNLDPLSVLEGSSMALTLINKDKPLTVVGATPRSIGVYAIYQFPKKGFEKEVKAFTEGMRNMMEIFMNITDAHRLETICKPEQRFYNWMTKGLGWEGECVLKAFGKNKEDFIQYRYVR